MTKAAVKQLENENGFFLLVEASQVDWGGHSNDIAYSMAEMVDFAHSKTVARGCLFTSTPMAPL